MKLICFGKKVNYRGYRAPGNGVGTLDLMVKAGQPMVGERMTKQRAAIYMELRSRTEQFDVDALTFVMRLRVPGISVFTVYRNLKAFKEAGLIERVATWQGRARYDGNVEPHGHFLCEPCGCLVDIEDEYLERPKGWSLKGRYGVIERVTLLLRGTCVECAQAGMLAVEKAESLERNEDSKDECETFGTEIAAAGDGMGGRSFGRTGAERSGA